MHAKVRDGTAGSYDRRSPPDADETRYFVLWLNLYNESSYLPLCCRVFDVFRRDEINPHRRAGFWQRGRAAIKKKTGIILKGRT